LENDRSKGETSQGGKILDGKRWDQGNKWTRRVGTATLSAEREATQRQDKLVAARVKKKPGLGKGADEGTIKAKHNGAGFKGGQKKPSNPRRIAETGETLLVRGEKGKKTKVVASPQRPVRVTAGPVSLGGGFR